MQEAYLSERSEAPAAAAALHWNHEQRRLKDLVPLEHNPFGKISQENRRRLESKVVRLGVFESATLDQNGVLLTFNKRHNLLMGLGRGEELFNVLVPNRPLSDAERQEIILASNVNEGQWVQEILDEYFDSELVASVGLSTAALEAEMAAALPGAPAPKEAEPEYPIVAEFSEKYDAVVIVCRNEIDLNFLREVLKLEKSQSYKSTEVGQTSIIHASQFIEAWKSRS